MKSDINFDCVIPNSLWIGSRPSCLEDIHYLQEELGVTDIIDLCEEYPQVQCPSDVTLHRFPVVEHTPPTLQQLKSILRIIESGTSNGVVYVHCRYGLGRAPTVILSYLMSIGVPLKKGFQFLKDKRPQICPSKSQMRFLREL